MMRAEKVGALRLERREAYPIGTMNNPKGVMVMPKVAVVLGSKSDLAALEPLFTTLAEMGIDADAFVCSAHRTPERAAQIAGAAREQGYEAIIAAAGMAAHLPGVLAAYTTLPVIGIPMAAKVLDGMDALLAIVQMPPGVPVATVGVGAAQNAALLAAQILGVKYPGVADKLAARKAKMARGVMEANDEVQPLVAEWMKK